MDNLLIPPHSIEAEMSVLGSMLIDSDAWDKISDRITEQDFYRNEHKLIWRHIARMIEQGSTVDVLTVSDSIQATKKLDLIGGVSYIGELASNTPSAANIRVYAEIVVKKRKERDFMVAGIKIQELAMSELDIDQKTAQAVEILQTLDEGGINDPVRASDALRRAVEGIERRYASEDEISGLKTHLNDFDEKTCGLHPGDLIIVAGRPSMGKTALAINIAENVALSDKTVLVFSLEMGDEQLALRSIASVGGINLGSLRSGRVQDDEWSRMSAALGKLHEAPLFIDQSSMITASQMHAKARRLKRKHGLSLIVIDYLQLMTDTNPGNTRNEELSSITRKLKLMAKDLQVPVICLSQLSRKVEERTNKRPMMSDLRESGAIEQDADMVVMMYRDDYYNADSLNKGIAEAIISKQRMGETGTILLTFQGEYSRFKDFSGTYQKQETKQRGFSKPRAYKDDE